MANFTPQEIEQFLQEFFDVVGTRQYIGARYVPIFGRKGETSIEWDNTAPYEPLTIVLYQGNSYTSRQYVPTGVEITNAEYWSNTGNYNAQIEQYRGEVVALNGTVTSLNERVDEFIQDYAAICADMTECVQAAALLDVGDILLCVRRGGAVVNTPVEVVSYHVPNGMDYVNVDDTKTLHVTNDTDVNAIGGEMETDISDHVNHAVSNTTKENSCVYVHAGTYTANNIRIYQDNTLVAVGGRVTLQSAYNAPMITIFGDKFDRSHLALREWHTPISGPFTLEGTDSRDNPDNVGIVLGNVDESSSAGAYDSRISRYVVENVSANYFYAAVVFVGVNNYIGGLSHFMGEHNHINLMVRAANGGKVNSFERMYVEDSIIGASDYCLYASATGLAFYFTNTSIDFVKCPFKVSGYSTVFIDDCHIEGCGRRSTDPNVDSYVLMHSTGNHNDLVSHNATLLTSGDVGPFISNNSITMYGSFLAFSNGDDGQLSQYYGPSPAPQSNVYSNIHQRQGFGPASVLIDFTEFPDTINESTVFTDNTFYVSMPAGFELTKTSATFNSFPVYEVTSFTSGQGWIGFYTSINPFECRPYGVGLINCNIRGLSDGGTVLWERSPYWHTASNEDSGITYRRDMPYLNAYEQFVKPCYMYLYRLRLPEVIGTKVLLPRLFRIS